MKPPIYEHGFWWWYDYQRKGWYVGTAPQIQVPSWARAQEAANSITFTENAEIDNIKKRLTLTANDKLLLLTSPRPK